MVQRTAENIYKELREQGIADEAIQALAQTLANKPREKIAAKNQEVLDSIKSAVEGVQELPSNFMFTVHVGLDSVVSVSSRKYNYMGSTGGGSNAKQYRIEDKKGVAVHAGSINRLAKIVAPDIGRNYPNSGISLDKGRKWINEYNTKHGTVLTEKE